ncbi:MAG: SpoIIE family protein phosphatase [Oscillospiraceae bacterium]|nr:SpoIIE family protein phosphatase [Oscillospiraceae bacterium]
MNKSRPHFDPALLHIPAAFAAALASGFLLSAGTVSGTVSTLAAALAGITPPLYSIAILLGALACYGVKGAPPGMHFLLAALVTVTCVRILFHEQCKPHLLALTTTLCGVFSGIILDVIVYAGAGQLPLYLFASVLTGTAAYFLADARDTLYEQRRITIHAGKTFTFSLCYLLCITALCGLDTPFFNIGRIVGLSLTLLFARQLRYTGGTLVGALTACGVTLCSVSLGTPMLFLPVTAMMAGFCSALPQLLFIPVFLLMQALSSAVLDGSRGLVREMTEIAVSCGLYVLLSQADLYRFLSLGDAEHMPSDYRRERFIAEAVKELREETSAVMHRLKVTPPDDPAIQIRERLCTGCRNYSDCWMQKSQQTAAAIRELVRGQRQGSVPPVPEHCHRRKALTELCSGQAAQSALAQMQRVHLLQNRQVTLEHLQLIEEVTAGIAGQRDARCLAPQTDALKRILYRCAAEYERFEVRRLRTGRIAAEILTQQQGFPVVSVQKLLEHYLRIRMETVQIETESGVRICLYQSPPYCLEYAMQSQNAPHYERCGDHCDAFTDCIGDQYLVLSDGMGSGSAASLASRIAVRTLRRMVESGMQVMTAVRIVNSMLRTETCTENFATLDVMHFHADCGEFELCKSGAAATLFCHSGKVQRISSMSLPIGIMTDALPSRKRSSAYAGDMIVMLSDGIGEAEYPYISQLLREGISPQEVVQSACEKSALFHGGQCRDDVTIIAARMTSRIQTESTKIDNSDLNEYADSTVSPANLL